MARTADTAVRRMMDFMILYCSDGPLLVTVWPLVFLGYGGGRRETTLENLFWDEGRREDKPSTVFLLYWPWVGQDSRITNIIDINRY